VNLEFKISWEKVGVRNERAICSKKEIASMKKKSGKKAIEKHEILN
jgi:hypothetical protein